ncbi:hypothetical protein [Limobrevibacterium gyesilva]|uniref:Transmembrane protein n=1 Tax=Limobrevibacterium gyesilva TaxID=2991712 RepID=A0AA42CJR9_9PROT|nr:hypothetical protein [Limobrevibacterium gyesilva]MCW3477140.1 hypothetical protein [Limobrevibacterium gyesilva]
MQITPALGPAGTFGAGEQGATVEASASGVSWPAIIGGAFVMAAASLILVTLGAGLGLASVSPWPNAGASATTFTVMTAIWLVFVQWVASGVGGYLTGRLRTKWVGLHTHEVFFRDTAHGFLTWAVAAIIGTAVLAAVVSSAVSGGARTAATVAAGTAQAADQAGAQSGNAFNPGAYYLDRLFRSDQSHANTPDQNVRTESAHILAMGMSKGAIPPADRTYLAQLISGRTGISQVDAEKRIDEVVTQEQGAAAEARQVADAARKAASSASIFTALSMLIGAFIACVAAALGGRQRDGY